MKKIIKLILAILILIILIFVAYLAYQNSQKIYYEGIELKKNCQSNEDCIGRCSPFDCFNKESALIPRTDCMGPTPSCKCIFNRCMKSERKV